MKFKKIAALLGLLPLLAALFIAGCGNTGNSQKHGALVQMQPMHHLDLKIKIAEN